MFCASKFIFVFLHVFFYFHVGLICAELMRYHAAVLGLLKLQDKILNTDGILRFFFLPKLFYAQSLMIHPINQRMKESQYDCVKT